MYFSKPSFECLNALVLIRPRSQAFHVSKKEKPPREEIKRQSKIDEKRRLNKKLKLPGPTNIILSSNWYQMSSQIFS
jgi:hypothetical protein